jgi:uncharacterized protein
MGNAVNSKEEVLACLRGAREDLVRLGVANIGLFGSFVNGQQTPVSDIDVLVEFRPEHHTFDSFMEVSFLLEELFGRKVDLVTPDALSPYIGPHILQEVERVSFAA